MSRLLLLLVLLTTLPAVAQEVSPVVNQQRSDEHALLDLSRGAVIPDTTEPWRYFPLEVGNTWEYLMTDNLILRKYVERDTIIDAKRYYIFNRQYFALDGDPASTIVRDPPTRFDTLTAHVVRATAAGDRPFYYPDCSFDLPFGSMCYDEQVTVSGGYDHLLVFPPPGGADSVYTAVKTLADIYDHEEWRFAAGFGEVYHYCGKCSFGWGLQAVRIGGWDGEVFGDLLVPPLPVASEEPPGRTNLVLQAWPNPFREQLTISLYVNESGPVVLTLYDLLGREVLQDLRQFPPGEHSITLEIPSLPAGAYVLRAATGGHVLTSTVLTRLK